LEHVGLHKFAAASWVSTEQSSGLLQGFISEVVSGASHVALVVFVVFFLLCELDSLGAKLRRLSDNADLQFERVDSIVRQVQLYLVVKLWTSVMSGVAAYMVLKLARVELALLLSLIFFILHFIPNIGAAIGTVAAIVFALVDRGVGTAAAVGCAFLLINTLIGNLVEPRMLGARLGVSPFAVLLGMLFWGWLWGPAGALLSVPILAATKIVLENIPDLAWISQLADTSSPERARAGHLGRLTQLGRLGEIAQRVSRVPPHDEPIGLGLGSHSATSRSAPRRGGPYETIPGFPQRQKSDPSPTVPSSPTTPSEPTPSAKS
jgi:predicted PurR-regulated permease PerM